MRTPPHEVHAKVESGLQVGPGLSVTGGLGTTLATTAGWGVTVGRWWDNGGRGNDGGAERMIVPR